MNFNFLSPVSDAVLAHNELLAQQTLGKKFEIHSRQYGIPELDDVKIAVIGVVENRNDINYIGNELNFDGIRKSLYSLYPGNWQTKAVDLGDILPGETVEDTYFALRTCVELLLERGIIPIILGGSQDLTYANYRAYDNIMPMVNIVNVDTNFDLGDASLPIKNKVSIHIDNVDTNFDLGDASLPIKNNSYLGKIIVEEPYNLFNYSTLGYQTYFNSQEEIDLMEKLYFEAYRLGEVSANINIVEPVMRDAHLVSVDLKSIRASEFDSNQKFSPNGFNGKEICAITRYAGISNKVSSFGIYGYNYAAKDNATTMLIAQSIWYFIEGVNCRVKDDDFTNDQNFQKYNVLVDEDELIFYRSLKTGRWWIEIPFLPNVNNKLKKHTLLPCTHGDYEGATRREIPERWYKAFRKNSF